MYGMVRRYRLRLGTVEQAASYVSKSLLPLLRQVPGFVTYSLFDSGGNTLASVLIFQTADGADAANRVASRWFRSDWPCFQLLPPELAVAEVLIHEGGRSDSEMLPAAVSTSVPLELTAGGGNGNGEEYSEDRRGVIERRSVDRRGIELDQRQDRLLGEPERRSASERRAHADRRSGGDRRSLDERRGPERGASPAWVPLLAATDVSPYPDTERPGRILTHPGPQIAQS